MIFNSSFINKHTYNASYTGLPLLGIIPNILEICLLPWELGKDYNNLTISWEFVLDIVILGRNIIIVHYLGNSSQSLGS